jgi:virulence factor Mce-like protein
MRRVLLSGSILLAVAAFVFISTGASQPKNTLPTYNVEFGNAFGLVTGAAFKVDGVPAGKIEAINLDQKSLNAVVKVGITTVGTPRFRSSATCDSQPQSLIGEYFVSCTPGSGGAVLRSGATIPVTHTQSTIPADLLLNVMRLPERQRFSFIINELGAAVAGRSSDIQSALDRAVPALTETDNLLNLLANDSTTLKALTSNSNAVVTALANNSKQVQRFIQYANDAASETAAQSTNFQATWHDLPGFLAQLRPALARLGQAAVSNLPVAANLNAASGTLDRFFTDLPGFAHSSLPAFRALGQASVTGKTAVIAARPTVAQLNRFAKPTPELAQNLAIVLPYLDNQKYATETNPRSPGGKGYTGLEAILQFIFNSSGAISYYGPTGHSLAVDAFASPMCSAYATPQTVASNLAQYGAAARSCYAFLGPNQPGVTTTDPSNPSACVPDPGGAPPGDQGTATSACKLSAASTPARRGATKKTSHRAGARKHVSGQGAGSAKGSSGSGSNPLTNLGNTIGGIVGGLLGGAAPSLPPTPSLPSVTGSTGSSSSGSTTSQTQQLLNYLLSP